MKNNTFSRISLFLLTILIGILANFDARAQGIDKSPFGLNSYSDPEYPQAMIGKRSLRLNLNRTTSTGIVERAVLYYSSRSGDLVRSRGGEWQDGPALGRRSIEGVKSFVSGGLVDGTIKVSAVLPWEKPTHREIEASKPEDEYAPGTTVYYRWEITRKNTITNKETIYRTDLKSFTMPRRITLAILGDSFGSGEGAPDQSGPTPWIDVLEGEVAHRSPISGQELAVKEFFEERPDFAYDYINVSCSGAVLESIRHELSEYMEEEWTDDGFIQSEKVAEWLSARGYTDLDTIILSISGNDFGFSKLVKAYMGISPQRVEDLRDWAKKWITCKIIDEAYNYLRRSRTPLAVSGCAWLGFTGWGYAACVATAYVTLGVLIEESIGELRVRCWNQEDELLARFWGPFTFHRNYGGWGDEAKSWNYYANFVEDQHFRMARKLSTKLEYNARSGTNSRQYVRPAQVIQTGYPTFFKGTNSYTETLGTIEVLKLLFDNEGMDFTVNVDRKINLPHPLPDVPVKFSVDFSSLLSVLDLPLNNFLTNTKIGNFDSVEINEINNELAPPYIRNGVILDRPDPGGINHCIREAVVRADNQFSSTDWCYVELDSFVPTNGHLGSSNRHFNRLSDAANREGPHLISNAFHPNFRGHRNIYRPAILQALEEKLTDDYFKEAAQKDGLGNLTVGDLPDFTFFDEALPGLSYNPNGGSLSITGSVTNRGVIKPQKGVTINPKIYVDPKIELPEEIVISPVKEAPSISPLGPGEFQDYDIDYEISNVPLRESLPFQIIDKNDLRPPVQVPPIFQNRQKVLRYFFSQIDATLALEISSDGAVQELNSPNNIVSAPIKLYPDPKENGLEQTLATVKKDLAGILGKEVETVDHALLIKDKRVRNYFGFYSPELDSKDMNVEQAIVASQRDSFLRIHRSLVGEDPGSPELYDAVQQLKPIYLFNSEDSPFSADGNTPVRGPRGRVRKLASVVRDAPRDGRAVTIGLPIKNQNFPGLNLKNEIVFTAKRPIANRGIIVPRDGQVLRAKDQIFQLGGSSSGDLQYLSLGTQIDGKEYLRDFALGNGEKPSIALPELPRDGRTIYATLNILSPEGLKQERYTYLTERRNATLLSPLPNDCLGGQNQIITWSEPDPKIGSSVEAYRIAIGTTPGSGDIVPGPSGLPSVGNDKLSGYGYVTIGAGTNAFSQRSVTLPKNIQIPQDGRVLHVTLGTLRDGEWEYENFQRGCKDTNRAGLVAPRFDLPIDSSFISKVAVGSSPIERKYRIRFGTAPNKADLFDSGVLSKELAMNGVQVLMPKLNPVLDDEGRPVPIWATLSALNGAVRPIEISKQSYALVPEMNATIFSPSIEERIDTGAKISFQWNAGYDAIGYKLTADIDLDGKLKRVHEVELGKDELEATLDFTRFQSRHLVIGLETVRDATSQIPSMAKGYRYRFDTPDLHFYEKDTIPDTWQFQEFGRSNADGLADADPDNDGTNNLMEYLSGTNPNDPNDRFIPIVKYSKDGDQLLIDSMIVNEPIYTTSYQLQSSIDLQTWKDVGEAVDPLPGGSSLIFRIQPMQESKIFYRFVLSEKS